MPCVGKRVFSNNQDTTFHNYLKNKKGIEIIKQLKSNSNSNKIKFLSYDDFITLTHAFSKNANIIHTSNHLSINNKTHNLIYYEKIQNHIQECDSCQKNNDNLLVCNGIKNILHIYQNNFKNTITNVFQTKLDLDRWCKSCDISLFPVKNIEEPLQESLNESLEEPLEENLIKEKLTNITIRKREKGNGRKPIFCIQCNKFIDICLCSHRWSRKDAINEINKNTK
uniref:Uncharacterized protein n=1 Tax=viral metagenome TaxID=1070528 RepID=A0A6C0BAD2_9ZZZZ